MTLDAKQRGVARGITIGGAITVVAVGFMLIWPPAWLVPTADALGRLRLAGLSALPVVLCLMIGIGWLARHRFFTPSDIDGSGLTEGTPRARALQAYLQNTLEQAVLALGAYAVWAATMPARWLATLPVAAALFVIGRILFARGYASGAPSRAIGFALTFYPTVLLLLIALVWLVADAV